ncbi:GNAT family N-acyltransferase [Alkalimonas amylolytica]|uniref:L-ornithine N(alpha)-acyltransferase n=1 Tax=Alkalimonas amylolytica TaxID=152573 RepID=A0A1H4FPB0_ALKAM|nr:lysophospholipid acyltransferase family protein [Alkalimonas amylolytica]SEA98322.1 Putative hemolysin [Alkalimonas amylolytica]
MFNVEQMLQQQAPQLDHKPRLKKLTTWLLRQLLHEKDFMHFAESYPHLQGLDFVEQVLDYFQFQTTVREQELERIPSDGRVVIIANHPIGSLDGLALIKLISEIRPDVKIVANQMLMTLPPLHALLFPVDAMQSKTRRELLDNIAHHLQQDGALIIFPAGEVSRLKPNGIRDGRWHHGFLRFATQAKAPVLPIHLQGRNSWQFYLASMLYKPLATLLLVREMFRQRQKQLQIRIGELIPFESFSSLALEPQARAKLFKKHLYRIGTDKAPLFHTQSGIALPEDRKVLKKAVEACHLLGETADQKQIYLYQHQGSSPVLREIGRLREVAFRAVGEGSGKRRDIDPFDSWYQHLILWDPKELDIVGSYRFADTAAVMAQHGQAGLYCDALFHLSSGMKPYLNAGLELGRSFVQPKYWGKRSLDYLWYGIGAYLKQRPDIRYLYGAVSLSNSYPQAARDLMVYFYNLYFQHPASPAVSRHPYVLHEQLLAELRPHFSGNDYAADFCQLKHLLANMGLSIPTLYKQYSELCEPGGAYFLSFGLDSDFSDCMDGLVLVDITKIKAHKKQRYMG